MVSFHLNRKKIDLKNDFEKKIAIFGGSVDDFERINNLKKVKMHF